MTITHKSAVTVSTQRVCIGSLAAHMDKFAESLGGADRSVIALWLGHEDIQTTSVYLQADMQIKQIKEQALAKTTATRARASRYQPTDRILAFLKTL